MLNRQDIEIVAGALVWNVCRSLAALIIALGVFIALYNVSHAISISVDDRECAPILQRPAPPPDWPEDKQKQKDI